MTVEKKNYSRCNIPVDFVAHSSRNREQEKSKATYSATAAEMERYSVKAKDDTGHNTIMN